MPDNIEFLHSLSRIPTPPQVSDTPSPSTEEELTNFAHQKERLKNTKKRAQIKSLKQDIRERKAYAAKIYDMLAIWLLFTGFIILLCSMGKISLSENVLIVLLTTASANVIAIFIYVVKYLFNTKL